MNYISLLQDDYVVLEQSLADAQKKNQELAREKQEIEDELAYLKAKVQNEGIQGLTTLMDATNFECISLCEVVSQETTGEAWLKRLADINRNGALEVFQVNQSAPRNFANRSRLFFKDGPNQTGAIGVWNWSAIPNNNDPSKDYVSTVFNSEIKPIEIIVIQDGVTNKELLEKLKTGVEIELTACRTIFASYQAKEQYTGFLCESQDFEQNGNQIKLRKNVSSIHQYNLNSEDFIRLPNGKSYLKSIRIGVPSAVLSVKAPMDIVKSVILVRNSWQLFKQQGKTRSEWKKIRNFLSEIDTNTVIDDITKEANCSHLDAKKMLNIFIENVGYYIDGTTFEDEIISAAIEVNPELMERCKALIKDDWIAENWDLVEKDKSVLAELEREIEQIRAQRDEECRVTQESILNQKKAADDELAAVKCECDELRETLQALSADISAKQHFADEVEAAVEQRIQQAQNNAADFVAGLAFTPKNIIASLTPVQTTNTFGHTTSEEEFMHYVPGIELNQNEMEKNNTWKDTLETLRFELMDAGVSEKYSIQLAAYLYAAYLNKAPLLMVGPNAGAIVDAFSGSVFGRMAGVMECIGNYSINNVESCYSSDDCVVKIINPFNGNWINRIPDIVSNHDKFYIAVYPYSEDMQIEPKSLYNYFLPIFTELFVDNTPTGIIQGGRCSEDYEEFIPIKANKNHDKLLKEMRTSFLVRNRIQTILNNMHAMLGDPNPDYDVIFALLPYAFATVQMPLILEAIQDGEKNKVPVSRDIAGFINELYGENE